MTASMPPFRGRPPAFSFPKWKAQAMQPLNICSRDCRSQHAQHWGAGCVFDPEYCIVCEADPARFAMRSPPLKSEEHPESYIRDKTLKKLEAERRRFLAMVDNLVVELGGQPQSFYAWPFGEISGVPGRHLRSISTASIARAA